MSFTPHIRTFTTLTTLLAGLLAAPGCDDGAPATERLAAYTPGNDVAQADPVAGMSLQLTGPAAIELADGEVVDLALSDEQRAGLECDGDARISQVLVGPLELGDRSFAAPVLEAACDGEGLTTHMSLREAGESCEGDGCIAFAPAIGGLDELPMTALEGVPAGACQAAGTRTCVSCGIGKLRPRTITQVNYDPNTGACSYGYSYGTCSTVCSE